MEIAVKLWTNITDKISDLISQPEEIKLDQGILPRTVRQWKKDLKAKYSDWVHEKNRLVEALNTRQREIDDLGEQWEW